MNNSVVTGTASTGTPDRTIFVLLEAAHALEDRVDAALARAGLSNPKFAVLSQLTEAGVPLSLSELAARLSCVKSNMTQLIDRLEADGLVARVDDPNDRRSVKAAITPRGAERQAAGAREIEVLHKEFAAQVGASDLEAVRRMLRALG